MHKQTYAELSLVYEKTPKTLRKYFDEYAGATGEMVQLKEPTVLILDATFFGRGYGILLCRTPHECLYWKEIITESMDEYGKCLDGLEAAEYEFSAVVVDGTWSTPFASETISKPSRSVLPVPSDPNHQALHTSKSEDRSCETAAFSCP